jgi:hypothetical protein
MNDYSIKAKTVIGRGKKTSGKIEVLKIEGDEPCSFRNLKTDLKGKILICPAKISKSILEKSRALGVAGMVCRQASEDLLSYLKEDLKVKWLSSLFILLIIDEEVDWDKIEGKIGMIEKNKKRLVVRND